MATLSPITADAKSIPAGGIKASVRFGECFGKSISWDKPVDVYLVSRSSVNPNGEPGIAALHYGWGYAGLEESTNTYWRYAQEADQAAYREHCMQVLQVY